MRFKWPASPEAISGIQKARKRIAVERALQSPFFKKRISHINPDRLEEDWLKIPVLTKEELRSIPPERFHDEFCIQPRSKAVEYWRSGGATGRPLFYPRSAEDMESNSMTPFLRWNSGDLVSLSSEGKGDGPWSVFPILHHARRTVGFFKVRGVNINHADLEDAMFREPEVVDFRAEVYNSGSGNDVLHLHVEMRNQESGKIVASMKKTFQVTPEVTLLPRGTIAREFEANIKAARFVDKRG